MPKRTKGKRINPTEKQKRAVLIAIANPRKTMRQVMAEAGYSKSMTDTPHKLTNTPTWNQLMDEHFPDALLAMKHRDLLMVPRKIKRSVRGDLVEEIEEVDSQALGKGLDMAYKLKGHYAAEKHEIEGKVVTDEELDARIAARLATLNQG